MTGLSKDEWEWLDEQEVQEVKVKWFKSGEVIWAFLKKLFKSRS